MFWYSPEKWLHNRIYYPSNRSKQIKEIHTAYSTDTQYTRQSLVVVVLRSPIHANEPSEYNGMLYRTSNRVLNNGIKVIILICMDGTSQYHHHPKFERKTTYMYGFTVDNCLAVKPCILNCSNFASYIVYRGCKPCEFLWFVWTHCWGNKSYYVITSPANSW